MTSRRPHAWTTDDRRQTARRDAGRARRRCRRAYYIDRGVLQPGDGRAASRACGSAPDAPSRSQRPGQFVVRELLGESIIVTRSGRRPRPRVPQRLPASRHAALHRRRLARFAGSIQCPYHAWTYDLDGRLIGAPHMDEVPHFRKEDYPLHRVARRRVGRPHLPQPVARTRRRFASSSAIFRRSSRPWRMDDLRLGHRIVYDVKANWKLIIQNYNECLHCPNLHPALNKLSHYLSGENEPLQRDLHGRAHGSAAGRRRRCRWTAPARARSCRGCPTRIGGASTTTRSFPNMLLSLHPDYMMVHTLWPIAPDRTINICEWHFHPTELARPDFDAVGRDRLLGHDEPPGLARLRAVAGGHLLARLHAGAVLEPRGSALRVRSDDRRAAQSATEECGSEGRGSPLINHQWSASPSSGVGLKNGVLHDRRADAVPHGFDRDLDLQRASPRRNAAGRSSRARSSSSAPATTSSSSRGRPGGRRGRRARRPATPLRATVGGRPQLARRSPRPRSSRSRGRRPGARGPRLCSSRSACWPTKRLLSRLTSRPRPISYGVYFCDGISAFLLLKKSTSISSSPASTRATSSASMPAGLMSNGAPASISASHTCTASRAGHPDLVAEIAGVAGARDVDRHAGDACRWSRGSTSGGRCRRRPPRAAGAPTSAPAAPAPRPLRRCPRS